MAAGQTMTEGEVDTMSFYTGDDLRQGKWIQHTGNSVDVKWSAEGLPSDAHALAVTVETYLPTVTLAGGGNMAEGAASPATFTVARDRPSGWGVFPGDDPVPATTVGIGAGGTLTDEDLTAGAPSAVTIPAGGTSASFTVGTRKDNLVAGAEHYAVGLEESSEHQLGASHSALLAVADDPPVVSVAVDDAAATEHATGQTANPGSFKVTRTGGDTSQAIAVAYQLGGTATAGTDYGGSGGGTVSVTTTGTITVTPTDDPDAEGVETVTATLTGPGKGYRFAAATATTQPTTLAAAAPVNLDDNVSVKSIEVARGSYSNASYGFSFNVKITVRGEHLDQVQIRQEIKSSTSLTDYNGNNLTRAQVLAKYPDSDPNVVDSDGQWQTDTNWNWANLNVKPNTKNGQAEESDSQLMQVPGGDIVSLDATTSTQINWLASAAREFRLQTRQAGASATLQSFDWGYKWSNQNCY